jgi:two-component system LytT family response regulator
VKKLTVLIVDDEAHARERLRRLLGTDATLEIVGECASGVEAVAAASSLRPDLMLLDIQMPGLDGFGVVQALPQDDLPLIVFITAHDEHALHAFDIHAVDYVLKPVEAPRLYAAISRARLRAKQESIVTPAVPPASTGSIADDESIQVSQRFIVRQDGQMYPIRTRDILYVEAEGNYVKLHVPERQFMVRETMTRMEQRLDPAQFARIHRSVIVNLDAVREMQPWFGGDYVVILKNGTRLKVSRYFKGRLEKWIVG